MTPNELARQLEKIYGDELKSVVAYGSSLGKSPEKKFKDINVFCVLSDPSPVNLARSNKLVRKWVKKGNNPPHFFGPKHIETSLDVFPMEFMDIKDNHEVLVGKNPLETIVVDEKNLRHECESELKGKLINMRSFYAENCHKPSRIGGIMVESLPTILAALRAALRLLGKTPPAAPKATVELLATSIDLNPEIFFEIISIREDGAMLPKGDDAVLMFERYMKEISVVTEFVDRLGN